MRGIFAAALLALAALFAPAAMAAEGERVLDPLRSLTGDCSVSSLDSKPDPGLCPMPPGVPGVDHPSVVFADPRAVATDIYGNIYVANFGKLEDGSEGVIDIFSPDGVFLAELVPPSGPRSLAIDSQGVLYVGVFNSEASPKIGQVLRYTPCAPYEPEAGNIEYCNPHDFEVVPASPSRLIALAINPEDDHLFANFGAGGVEYRSAAEGNGEFRTFAGGGSGVAVDAARDRLIASVEPGGTPIRRIDIFDLTKVVGSEYEKVDTIEASAVPGGSLGNRISVAVDEATGHIFALDTENSKLHEFDEEGNYITTIDSVPIESNNFFGGQIGVDNGPLSPNGALSTRGRYLYVPSHKVGTGHSFAFEESKVDKPDVKPPIGATNVSEDEAELVAQVNPHNLPTTYKIEYITEQLLEQNEKEAKEPFAGATLAGEGTLAGNLDVEVSAATMGLKPGTSYRFRVFAENEEGSDAEEASFATYPSVPVEPEPCSNLLLRTGPSALLPDCRAYELVTPPDTNGRAPIGTTREINSFTIRQVSPGGEALPFKVEGGSLPGPSGTGSFLGDPYLSTRTATGWQTAYIGPSGAEASVLIAGTGSPDQGYTFWRAEEAGTAVLGGPTNYVRFPDGHSELIGQGSLGTDNEAVGRLISEGGEHIVFTSGGNTPAVRLEPTAPPDGTWGIYDRVPDPVTGKRETKVVSLLPGEVPLEAGENAQYMGASLNGELVAFEVLGTLYLRYQNAETFEIGTGVEYAGIAESGERVFYLEGGDLKAFDATTEAEIEFTETGDAEPVFLAAEGTAAYFVSETAIAGSGPNPEGEEPQVGKRNLYLSSEGQVSFVATVTDRDVDGEFLAGIESVDGLGLWVEAAGPQFPGRFGAVPARSSADGSVLLFKSRAPLTDYENPEEKAQIYRYDAAAEELRCLSCNPTGAPPDTDAGLQTERREEKIPLSFSQAWIENLRADGRRAFFESSEPLVAGDNDGLKDVYEWEDQGVGSCTRPEGCLYLISSPQSMRNEYLWAVSESGEDVFFFSSELLVGADADSTPSIYDARVGGGFAQASPPICQGEGCRPRLTPPPSLPSALTPVLGPGDNLKPRPCGKGKRKVKRAGKVRCVKKKKHKQHRRKGGRR